MRAPCPWLILAFSVIAAGGCAPPEAPAGQGAATAAQAIINGDQCPATTSPTALAILVDATVDFSSFGGGTQDITTVLCTGTLIAPDVVLTAAHCTDVTALTMGFGDVERADFYVSFDPDLSALAGADPEAAPPELPASAVPVREALRHEGFSLDSMGQVEGPGDYQDVALLFLAVTVDDVVPAVVIDASEVGQLTEGAAVSIAGWGQQTVTGQFESPPAGTVGIKVCGSTTINELGDTEMQIGSDPSTTRKCHGDSGGPTYLDVETTHDVATRVVGITSHAYDQSDCNKGGVDTRVDAYLDWIDAAMSARCSDATRVWCEVPGIVPPSFYDASSGGNDDDDDDDDDDNDDQGPGLAGCPGCTQGGADASVLALAVFLLAAIRRRASSSAQRPRS